MWLSNVFKIEASTTKSIQNQSFDSENAVQSVTTILKSIQYWSFDNVKYSVMSLGYQKIFNMSLFALISKIL